MHIINVDETNISKTDFRLYKWQHFDQNNSMPNPLINPRISLIAGVSNHGQLYMALSQANTNAENLQLFLAHLAKLLDKERPQWRKNTIF